MELLAQAIATALILALIVVAKVIVASTSSVHAGLSSLVWRSLRYRV